MLYTMRTTSCKLAEIIVYTKMFCL